MEKKTAKRVNLTICQFHFEMGVGLCCAVKQQPMLFACNPPLMDTVIDTASEGLRNGQTTHLLKLSYYSGSYFDKACLLFCKQKILGFVREFLFAVAAVRGTQCKAIKSVFWPYVALQQFSVAYFKCFFLNKCRVLISSRAWHWLNSKRWVGNAV